MDEVSYGADHKFLTCVADHETGGIVWATEGRNAASLQAFFDGLTDEQKASIRAVSIDMSAGYENAIRGPTRASRTPRSCFDPFHVVQLGGKAADQVRRDEYNQHGRSSTGEGKWIKGTRYSLLKDHRQADREAAAQARRGRADQQAYVPRVPALRRAALHLPAPAEESQPSASTRGSRGPPAPG